MKDPQERVSFFERIERNFAWQARGTTLLVGVSGFYITAGWDLWSRFESPGYWWMHAMVFIWIVLHSDAVRRGAAFSSSLVHYKGDGEA